MAKAKSAKSVGTRHKVRPVGPDGFYSDEPEQKNVKKSKTTYDRSTGKHVKKATKLDAKKWWRQAMGTDKAGSGRLAKSRKQKQDKTIKEAGG